MEYSQQKVNYLEAMAKKLRLNVILSVGVDYAGHIGGSLSSADIVSALYFYKMRYDPSNPSLPERDRFLLSKGHVAILQYAALVEAGFFPRSELKTTKQLGSMLQGHPDVLKTPGVEAGTGSLGQGLSIGLGMALGLRDSYQDSHVYVLCGDGEMAEGQIWEAAMAAGAYHTSNLVAIVDQNGLQANGRVEDRLNTNPLSDKWRACGWNVLTIDGHDMRQIMSALDTAAAERTKPTVIIAKTVKGKGLSFAENVVSFHNGKLTQEQFEQALKELEGDEIL